MANPNYHCDPETGVCTPMDLAQEPVEVRKTPEKEIIYVGDPMCSWCWGISNHLQDLKKHFSDVPFSLVVGGLRPGGGDPWNDQMKDFLKHHWHEVNKRSGQPFGYDLFDREEFNYDTEPSCRAVVAARTWVGERELEFYEAVSRHFYVDNADPNEMEFYEPVCEKFGIPFQAFKTAFESEEVKKATHQEFLLNREWGVTGYPTVIYRTREQLFLVSPGYSEFDKMKETIEQIESEPVAS
ncbi:MAG: DsbA family protein [Bacteroidota bacterium]